MRRPRVLVATLGIVAALVAGASFAAADKGVSTSYGLSIYGDLKYKAGFKHFEYVNPEAPRGGDVRLAAIGTFDSLNPYILKGVPAAGLGQLFEPLTVASWDEPASEYGLLAESIEVPADRSWVAFTLRPEARFHDGSPVTVDDVIWTFQALKTKGHPFYRSYYAQIVKAEGVGPRKVKFTFRDGAAVRDLLMSVWAPARRKAEADAAVLQAMMAAEGISGPLEPWDWRFYSERRRKAEHDLDEAALKPYLSLEAMLGAMFDCSTRLFGLEFREIAGLMEGTAQPDSARCAAHPGGRTDSSHTGRLTAIGSRLLIATGSWPACQSSK